MVKQEENPININTEEGEKNQEPNGDEELKEPQENREDSGQENPVTIKIIPSPQNMSLYNRLSDGTKDFVSGLYQRVLSGTKNFAQEKYEGAKSRVGDLYEKVKIKTVDRVKIMYEDSLIDWHNKKSQSLENSLGVYQNELEQVNNIIKEHDETLVNLNQSMGGVPQDIFIKAEKEKTKLISKREALQKKIEINNSKLDYRNTMKASYENTRKDIVEDTQKRLKERLDPHENRLESLHTKKDSLDSEIVAFNEKKEEFKKGIIELEGQVEEALSVIKRDLLNSQIKEIKDALKDIDKNVKLRQKESRRIEREVGNLKAKSDNIKIINNEFSRISKREVRYPEVEPLEVEEANLERVDILTDNKTKTAETMETVGGMAVENHVSSETDIETLLEQDFEDREVIEEAVFSPEDYINEWNSYFGSQLNIKPQFFYRITGANRNQEMSISDLEKTMMQYNNILKNPMIKRFSLTAKEIDQKLKTLRVFLSNKENT